MYQLAFDDKIDLSSCLYLRALPEDAGGEGLDMFSALNLSYCKRLQSLPRWFPQCSSLKSLSLISCSSLHHIDVGWPPQLETLDLTNCSSLTSLPQGLASTAESLRVLRLRGCTKLPPLPWWMVELTALRELDLIGCDGAWSESELPHIQLNVAEGPCAAQSHWLLGLEIKGPYSRQSNQGFFCADERRVFKAQQWLDVALLSLMGVQHHDYRHLLHAKYRVAEHSAEACFRKVIELDPDMNSPRFWASQGYIAWARQGRIGPYGGMLIDIDGDEREFSSGKCLEKALDLSGSGDVVSSRVWGIVTCLGGEVGEQYFKRGECIHKCFPWTWVLPCIMLVREDVDKFSLMDSDLYEFYNDFITPHVLAGGVYDCTGGTVAMQLLSSAPAEGEGRQGATKSEIYDWVQMWHDGYSVDWSRDSEFVALCNDNFGFSIGGIRYEPKTRQAFNIPEYEHECHTIIGYSDAKDTCCVLAHSSYSVVVGIFDFSQMRL